MDLTNEKLSAVVTPMTKNSSETTLPCRYYLLRAHLNHPEVDLLGVIEKGGLEAARMYTKSKLKGWLGSNYAVFCKWPTETSWISNSHIIYLVPEDSNVIGPHKMRPADKINAIRKPSALLKQQGVQCHTAGAGR